MYNWYMIDLLKHWLARRTMGRMVIAVVSGWFVSGVIVAVASGVPGPVSALVAGLVMWLVPSMVAVGIYHQLIMRLGRGLADGETHCRKCDYILHGISEPRCPECGEMI